MRGAGSHPLDPRAAEQAVRAQDQHGEQREVGGDAAEAGAERAVEVAGAQAFEHADRDGGDQRPGDAVDPAQDDDREDLQPDQRRRRCR